MSEKLVSPDKDEAFCRYLLLLSRPEVAAVSPSAGRSVAGLHDHFRAWTLPLQGIDNFL